MSKRITMVLMVAVYLIGLMVYASLAQGAWWAGPVTVLGSIGLYFLGFAAVFLAFAVIDAAGRRKWRARRGRGRR